MSTSARVATPPSIAEVERVVLNRTSIFVILVGVSFGFVQDDRERNLTTYNALHVNQGVNVLVQMRDGVHIYPTYRRLMLCLGLAIPSSSRSAHTLRGSPVLCASPVRCGVNTST